MDVEKVDRDVAYVAMAIHVCCKRLFQMFHLFFQMYVANVFIWLLHMFHTYVASVFSGCCVCFTLIFKRFSGVFASVSDVCFKYFICFQTYIAIVASEYFKTRSGVASPFPPFCCLIGAGGGGPTGVGGPMYLWASAAGEMWAGRRTMRDGGQQRGRPDRGLASERPGASTIVSHIPPLQ